LLDPEIRRDKIFPKTKEEVLDKITNPETKEAARVAIEAEEQSEQSEPRRRRRR